MYTENSHLDIEQLLTYVKEKSMTEYSIEIHKYTLYDILMRTILKT